MLSLPPWPVLPCPCCRRISGQMGSKPPCQVKAGIKEKSRQRSDFHEEHSTPVWQGRKGPSRQANRWGTRDPPWGRSLSHDSCRLLPQSPIRRPSPTNLTTQGSRPQHCRGCPGASPRSLHLSPSPRAAQCPGKIRWDLVLVLPSEGRLLGVMGWRH